MIKTETTLQNHSTAIRSLETQIGQLARAISKRPQGALPRNGETNLEQQLLATSVN